jgi:hypothetical protein
VRSLFAIVATSAVIVAVVALSGCSSAEAADMQVGDCLQVGGPPDRPDATKVECGSSASNFKVVATAEDANRCPSDADSSFSMRKSFSNSGTTVCMDIDWVVGGCMSIDPEHQRDPVRVECADSKAPNRQRATQIIQKVGNVDQCATGLGYAYQQRQFTVCVEAVS